MSGPGMGGSGTPGEYLRISQLYRRMTDDELLGLAGQKEELTEMVQQALADEMSQRKLKAQPEEEPAPPILPGPVDAADPDFDEDRVPVPVCTVWSRADALKVQASLDAAGIPFFMGEENAGQADRVTSNFADGVEVKVMRIGVPWVRQALQDYEPQDEPKSVSDETEEMPVECPKCHSEEVVFEELVPGEDPKEQPTKFHWKCDSCGNEWEDDGVAKEV